MRYLLDTNTVSDLVRAPGGRVAQRIREVGETQVCTSIIVAAELRYGAAKRRSRRLSAQVETVLGALDVLPFEAPADAVYGMLRARLERVGTPIGANDLLIAAQAIAFGCAMVTDTSASLPESTIWLRRTGCVRPNEGDIRRSGSGSLVSSKAEDTLARPQMMVGT